jgi:hypothetical protein
MKGVLSAERGSRRVMGGARHRGSPQEQGRVLHTFCEAEIQCTEVYHQTLEILLDCGRYGDTAERFTLSHSRLLVGSGNGFGAAGATELAPAISSLEKLEQLDLRCIPPCACEYGKRCEEISITDGHKCISTERF